MSDYLAWEWAINDELAYVGCGEMVKGVHPATKLWLERTKYRSQLNDWLVTLSEEPKKSRVIPNIALTKEEARMYAFGRKRELKLKGITLLSTRPFGTTKGGGAPLGVIDEHGTRFPSVRAAAEAHKVTPCTVSRYVRDPLSGWSFQS